jgi:hypothetical protein
MEWKFTLDRIEIDEPIGFEGISFNVMRDDRWHGIFFEASNTQLSFYGSAFDILKGAKESYGVDAVVIFAALSRCEGQAGFTEAISGKLNFSNYQETCGTECLIRMPVEQDNCAMVFKNRFDQKVNIDSAIAFDKITNLANYTGLGFNMELATQEIPISADADVSLDSDLLSLSALSFFLGEQNLLVRPIYERVTDNSILTGQLNDPSNNFQDPTETFLLSPQILLEENSGCILTEFDYTIRLKGAVDIDIISSEGSGATFTLRTVVDYWDGNGTHVGPGNLTGDATALHNDLVGTLFDAAIPFDVTYTGTVSLPAGSGLYAYIKIYYSAGVDTNAVADFAIDFDPETSFLLSNTKACPPTDADVYLINETLARATESITDRCLTIQSDYYGRTDSQPYSSNVDGCGSLRVVTPGLKIRQATDKQFFASMKELMEGLRAIDNIGMGMQSDRVRIEPAEYFYQNTKILDIPLIPKAISNIEDQLVYSNLKTGYSKWEIKSIKGIDELNSAKEYRTGIKSVSNELDIRSNLIAAGYIIENLRTQTLVNTGNTDSTYDNDVFIICVDRDAYGYHVEQGIAENSANFFSPATAYNWRIRPVYNLMRWFKSIAQSYVSLVNTTSKLFFTSGTGNYLAEGNISVYDSCRIENKVLAENDDIDYNDFQNTDDATPIYQPEIITFDYPLSLADYKLIKSNPYGYLNVQCGQGVFFQAYIKNVQYKPAEGMATFTLIKKWQN